MTPSRPLILIAGVILIALATIPSSLRGPLSPHVVERDEWRFHVHELTCQAGSLASDPVRWRQAMGTIVTLRPAWADPMRELPALQPALDAAHHWQQEISVAAWQRADRARNTLWADLRRAQVIDSVFICAP